MVIHGIHHHIQASSAPHPYPPFPVLTPSVLGVVQRCFDFFITETPLPPSLFHAANGLPGDVEVAMEIKTRDDQKVRQVLCMCKKGEEATECK